jgi:hypothetical protein
VITQLAPEQGHKKGGEVVTDNAAFSRNLREN